MNSKTNRKVILITGSSKGIGKSICEHFLKSPEVVVIGCSRSPSTIKHKKYIHYQIDMSKKESSNELIQHIKKDVNQLNALINNVGTAAMNHLLLTTSEKVDQIINLNLKSVINLTREAVKLIKKEENGRIINMTTVAVPLSLEGEAVYVSSKAGIEAFTKTIAKELNSFGITVNAIGPGPVKTDLIKNISENKIKKILSQLSCNEFTRVSDIINVIDFLLKKESRLINGQIIYLG